MALPSTELEWLTALSIRHDAEMQHLLAYDAEYELRSPLSYLHPEIAREFGERMAQVVVAWPLLVIGSLEERLDVEGFQLPDDDGADEEMWRVWQANNCDEESQLAHVDTLTMRRSYICVGANEDDPATPLVTFESPLEMYADVDPRNRRTRASIRRWIDNQDSLVRLPERFSTLYLPNVTVHYDYAANGWRETGRDHHNLGEVPVVPMVNRARLGDRLGRSEMDPILPLSHAVNKLTTDMMVAAEFLAVPTRGFLGIGPDQFEDAQGNKLTAMQVAIGRLMAIPASADLVKQFEFAAAQLTNFETGVKLLAQLTASIAGLPPHYLGMATDNPPSADSIRSNEARLVKRAERKQRSFGGPHEKAQRLVNRFQAGDWDPKLRQLATIWRDASTPTIAQRADASSKLKAERIISTRQAQRDQGYTPVQIARMEIEMADEDARTASVFKLPTAAEQADQLALPPAPVPAVAGATT